MIMITKKALMTAALSVGATLIAGSAYAGEEPPHEKDVVCHNIGGPRDLGANCDGTGACTYELEGGGVIAVAPNHFLGIVIGASDQSLEAHIAHGDGFAIALFDPPLHLASEIGPHQASNVECLAERIVPQPPEPGN